MNSTGGYIVRDDGVDSSNLSTPTRIQGPIDNKFLSRPEFRPDTGFSSHHTDRFWDRVNIGEPGKCWHWKRAVSGSGYGDLSLNGVRLTAHKAAYILATAEWPDETQVVRHKCDNPLCCNPSHLEIGSYSENGQDMVERGRHFQPPTKGEQNGNAKLTAADVELMREFIALGWTNKGLAKRFGVTQANISAIRHGKSWTRL